MKENTLKASLVIPLFNNEKTLVAQLKKCDAIMKKLCYRYEIIVCEDKSIDSSRQLLKKYFAKKSSFRLLYHRRNMGIAKTIYELYKKARYPYIVLFSVDGDWEPKDIEKLLKSAHIKDADIVIGKRTYNNYSFYRKFVSFFYNFLPHLLFQVKTIDAGSIKVIKRELIHTVPITSTSVFFEAEIIIRIAKKGGKIISLPVVFKKQKDNKGLGGKITLVVSSFVDLISLRLRM